MNRMNKERFVWKKAIANKERIFYIAIIIGFIIFNLIFGIWLAILNQEKYQHEGELYEIQVVRDQLKDISDQSEELWYDFFEKDFTVNQMIHNNEINDSDAPLLLKPLVHKADVLFAKFLMLSNINVSTKYINYNILEYITEKFVPQFSHYFGYQTTQNLIQFSIIISDSDNIDSYLNRYSIYGDYDLSSYKALLFITESNWTNYFIYNKTWEIFYNNTNYGVFRIFGNIQLFNLVIEEFFVHDLFTLERDQSKISILLNVFNFLIILTPILYSELKRTRKDPRKISSLD